MLTIRTLSSKNKFVKGNGDIVLDLTKASIEYTNTVEYQTMIIVTEDYVMRPDLVAKATLGNESKLDYILKLNNISNPFSIDVGDILAIPVDDQMNAIFKTPDVDDLDAIKAEQVNIVKITTVQDQKRIEMLKAQSNKIVVLPPNIVGPGENNIKYRDGKVIFGEDITSINKDNCPDNLSRAKLKEKLLNKKIFK